MMSQAMEDTQKQEAFIQELEAAKYALSFKYGPLDWKSEYLQWDADAAIEEAKSRMIEKTHLTMRDYQAIYRDFLGSLQDYHVRALFYSTEWSAFPIVVKSANNRYFLTDFTFDLNASPVLEPDEFDVDKYLDDFEKLQLGDEIIAFNGVPIKEVIERLIDTELSGDHTQTGYALAEKMLFVRYGLFGHDIPVGEFTLTIQPPFGSQYDVLLPWIHVKEWVTDPEAKDLAVQPANLKEKLERFVSKDFSVALAKNLVKSPLSQAAACDHDDEEEEFDWREKSFVPPLGKILWETDTESDHYAYIYLNEYRQKVGYLYIPHFGVLGDLADIYMEELVEIINRFEKETDALVVDMNDNTGGSLFYMYALMSLLTDKPLANLKDTEILIQKDIYQMASLYNWLKYMLDEGVDDKEELLNSTLGGYPITEELLVKMMNYAKSLLDQWDSGIRRTTPDYLFGLDTIEPNPKAHYTKPILLLTNEYDFSCGDLMPAILQDNKRATLFGRKTAGAGGYVLPYFQTSQFGVALYTLTGSLAYRADGSVIENLGVTPDIPCSLTERDLQFGFIDYVRAVNRQVNLLTK